MRENRPHLWQEVHLGADEHHRVLSYEVPHAACKFKWRRRDGLQGGPRASEGPISKGKPPLLRGAALPSVVPLSASPYSLATLPVNAPGNSALPGHRLSPQPTIHSRNSGTLPAPHPPPLGPTCRSVANTTRFYQGTVQGCRCRRRMLAAKEEKYVSAHRGNCQRHPGGPQASLSGPAGSSSPSAVHGGPRGSPIPARNGTGEVVGGRQIWRLTSPEKARVALTFGSVSSRLFFWLKSATAGTILPWERATQRVQKRVWSCLCFALSAYCSSVT